MPIPKKLLVVRHCQAHGQDSDAKLTPLGQQQADVLASFLGQWPIERIVSSPFVRAVQSITPLARSRNLCIETDERLVERILGSPTTDWLERLRATFEDLDLRLPGGESSREGMIRARAAVDDILLKNASTTVVVTHGNLMALLLKHFTDRFGFADWRSLTNPDVYAISIDARGTSVVRVWGRGG